MPEMKPVKNTEREHRWPQNIGVFQPVKYLHNLYGNSILAESFRQTDGTVTIKMPRKDSGAKT
jgi:hypothetical protein